MIKEEYVTFEKIPNYEDYGINRSGDVYSFKSERLLKPHKRRGYLSVALSKNNIRKDFAIHRLVAIVYIPNPNGYPIINHKNCITTDNRVENLEWCTYSYNTKYSSILGRQSGMKGKKHSEESKLKMSKSRRGIPLTDEWKLKIGKAMKDRVFSDETIQKMKHPHRGKAIIDTRTCTRYESVSEYRRRSGLKEWIVYKLIKRGELKYDK